MVETIFLIIMAGVIGLYQEAINPQNMSWVWKMVQMQKLFCRKIVAIRVRFIVKQIIFILRYHARIIVKLNIKTTIYIMLLKLMRVLRPFAQKELLLWIKYLQRKNFLIFLVHPNLSSNLISTYKKALSIQGFFYY